jgi:hypothetical protein
MEEIYEPNASFNFDQLVLSTPTSILGGNYFIKFSILGNPLYIQSPKCYTKSGIAKAGKKLYCDLMMSNDNENFIQWLENLENYSQECIFKNRVKWFETELEKHDIENSFASPVKTYKSGKYYITRTNVPTSLGKCSLKIYDENENSVNIDQIKDTTNIITILEIQGIKCSARSFQIEIELKQMMVVKPSKLFEKCIIKSQTNKQVDTIEPIQSNDMIRNLGETINSKDLDLPKQENLEQANLEDEDIFKMSKSISLANPIYIEKHSELEPLVKESDSKSLINSEPPLEKQSEPSLEKQAELSLINSEPSLAKQKDLFEMTEIEFSLDELPETETVQIKKRNDVYYQMYREAKKKAKLARDLALSTYLDAKRIKNTYMLDEIDDDSDLEEDEIKFQ